MQSMPFTALTIGDSLSVTVVKEGGDHWTLRTVVAARGSIGNRPWSQLVRQRTGLARAMKKLGYAPV